MHTLFTFGASHTGFKWFDAEKYTAGPFKNILNHMSRIYQEHFFLQNLVTLGDYFYSTRGWNKMYSNSSNFIEDLNNNRGNRPEYKERLLALKHFGLYKFK